MLTRLSIKKFRLLRDVTIDIQPGKPVVLIGPHSSGKSSLLMALDLLGRWAQSGYDEGLPAFGGSQSLVNLAADASAATLEITALREENEFPPPRRVVMHYGASFYRRSGAVAGEWLYVGDEGAEARPLLRREPTRRWIGSAENSAKDAQAIGPDEGLSFESLDHPELSPVLEQIRTELAGIHVYDGFLTTPVWARDRREGRVSPFDSVVITPTPRLDRRGVHLVNALYHLQNNDGDAWDELIDAFRAEFPTVQRIEFPADPLGGRISLGFRDRRYPGVRLSGHQMSEGMTSYLCLLAAILSPAPRSALVIDEPLSLLGPAALGRVTRLLEQVSERSAVFVATRSPEILGLLADPMGSVRVCEPVDDYVLVRPLDEGDLEVWPQARREPPAWPAIEVHETQAPPAEVAPAVETAPAAAGESGTNGESNGVATHKDKAALEGANGASTEHGAATKTTPNGHPANREEARLPAGKANPGGKGGSGKKGRGPDGRGYGHRARGMA